MEWKWSGSFSGYDLAAGRRQRTTSYITEQPITVPALASHIARLEAAGFILAEGKGQAYLMKDIIEPEGGENSERYSFGNGITLDDGTVRIHLHVKADGKTPEAAIAEATVTALSLLALAGVPVESGRGQQGKCRAIAEDIRAKYGRLLDEGGYIAVPYLTRAGRGGWKSKVAYRCYYLKDFVGSEVGDEA